MGNRSGPGCGSVVALVIAAVVGWKVGLPYAKDALSDVQQSAKEGWAEVTGLDDGNNVRVPRSARGAQRMLRSLDVQPTRPDESDPTYDRSLYMSDWDDPDGNGCDQRDDVLERDVISKRPHRSVTSDGCDHDMIAGTWRDPYTGNRMRFTNLHSESQASDIQVDHIVALGEVHKSGGRTWSAARRESYAQSLPGLIAADGPTNGAKSDHDPAAWKPKAAYQCRYAKEWIAVKKRWDLSVDKPEKRALRAMLATCPKKRGK